MSASTIAAAHTRERSRAHSPNGRTAGNASAPTLARYVGAHGCLREIVVRVVPRGALVIDRDAATLSDARLVAQLDPDEPAPPNAHLVCQLYLADGCRRCRPVTEQDARPPHIQPPSHEPMPALVDGAGRQYELRVLPSEQHAVGELRWVRHPAPPAGRLAQHEAVTVREVIGALESYEPVRDLTRTALADRAEPSTVTLASELRRLNASRIVLNRGLREAVQRALTEQDLSLSAIATRCGRIKRDANGATARGDQLARPPHWAAA